MVENEILLQLTAYKDIFV